jgi:mannose/cellobiose epimerase-like protein (N-acyl-D-glucosamine 2-epimerase family)
MDIDKLKHFGVGIAIYTSVYSVLAVAGVGHRIASRVAIVFGIGAGALKEAFDHSDNKQRIAEGLQPIHSVEWGDFFSTMAGTLLANYVLVVYMDAD